MSFLAARSSFHFARQARGALRQSRTISLSNIQFSPHTPYMDRSNTLFEQNLAVPSSLGGSLSAKTPFDTHVSPMGTTECPNLDRAIIKLQTDNSSLKKEDVSTKVSQDGNKLRVTSENIGVKSANEVKQQIKIPMVHNVDVRALGKAQIVAQDFIESDYCHLQSESGEVTVANVKTKSLKVQTLSGDIVCAGSIQGNIVLESKSGDVIVDKRLTGPALEIATHSGDIRVASCYSDTSKFSTDRGSMHLRNIHNETYVCVYEKGDVVMMGMDGSANIFVKQGDVNCQISRVRAESRIHVEDGDITVKISDNFPLKIDIEGNDIIPDAKFKDLGQVVEKEESGSKTYSCSLQPEKFSPNIYIIAENGSVVLESQDWAASLGLKMPIAFDKSGTLQ